MGAGLVSTKAASSWGWGHRWCRLRPTGGSLCQAPQNPTAMVSSFPASSMHSTVTVPQGAPSRSYSGCPAPHLQSTSGICEGARLQQRATPRGALWSVRAPWHFNRPLTRQRPSACINSHALGFHLTSKFWAPRALDRGPTVPSLSPAASKGRTRRSGTPTRPGSVNSNWVPTLRVRERTGGS